jgi:uncharacterized protein (TIGR00251 family)
MKIEVKVSVKSGKQEIVNDNGKYIVKLKSAPENNKANVELVKLLQKHFKKSVRIKSGLTSRNKIVEVEK